jgi:hypothetical protein
MRRTVHRGGHCHMQDGGRAVAQLVERGQHTVDEHCHRWMLHEGVRRRRALLPPAAMWYGAVIVSRRQRHPLVAFQRPTAKRPTHELSTARHA